MRDKPDNVVRLMYEFFFSLGMFAVGPSRHKKVQQLNKLIQEYGANFLSGCETRTNWHFIADKEDRFCNLLRNGQLSRGLSASNTNDEKISMTNGVVLASLPWVDSPHLSQRWVPMTPALGSGRGCTLVGAGQRHKSSLPSNHAAPRNGPGWEKRYGTNIPDALRQRGRYKTLELCFNWISSAFFVGGRHQETKLSSWAISTRMSTRAYLLCLWQRMSSVLAKCAIGLPE